MKLFQWTHIGPISGSHSGLLLAESAEKANEILKSLQPADTMISLCNEITLEENVPFELK